MKAKPSPRNPITEGVIWQQILLFFFPILFGTFFQQLYNAAKDEEAKLLALRQNASTILASLKRMAVIPGDFEIYPGHMETSTLAIERVYNPYVFAALNGVTEF